MTGGVKKWCSPWYADDSILRGMSRRTCRLGKRKTLCDVFKDYRTGQWVAQCTLVEASKGITTKKAKAPTSKAAKLAADRISARFRKRGLR